MQTKRTIIITRNGETQVVTGWRAWVLGFGGVLFAWLVLGLLVFVLVGIATTIGIALLLLIPAAVIVAVAGQLLTKR